MSSDYAKYIKELKGYETVEDENGFAIYGFMSDGDHRYCYIEDIYVKPEKRKHSIASSYADQIAKIAVEAKCSRLLGSVVPSYDNSHYRMQVLLSYGFKLHSAQNDLVYFYKELING